MNISGHEVYIFGEAGPTQICETQKAIAKQPICIRDKFVGRVISVLVSLQHFSRSDVMLFCMTFDFRDGDRVRGFGSHSMLKHSPKIAISAKAP